MWSRCIQAVSLLAVAGVAMAGCASTPTRAAALPSASVRTSPTASPSPSPSPTPSPTPRASAIPFLSSADEDGAHAFVVAYFAEVNRAFATGDVSRLVPYREATCTCVGQEELIVKAYSAGGQITGVNIAVLGWAWGAHGPAFARTAIAFHMPATRQELPGRPTVVDPPVNGAYAIDLRREFDHWLIRDIRFKQVT